MLGVFSGEVVEVPAELVAAGSRTPSPKTRASELIHRFVGGSAPAAVSIRLGDLGNLAYSHANQSPFSPRLFAAKDEIYCIFEGVLTNLGSLRQQYGLSKSANEVILVIEAYKALRDRAPFPPSFMLAHLDGNFNFVLFDKSTSTILVASDPDGRVTLYWGITADGYLAFGNDLALLKGSCGKSLAPFPKVTGRDKQSILEMVKGHANELIIPLAGTNAGCYYSNALGGLKCYENPKHKVTAVLENEEEVCGATFKVEGSAVLAATH